MINAITYRQQETEEEEEEKKSHWAVSRNLCSHTCNQVPQLAMLH